MTTQTEQQLENSLIDQLQTLGFDRVSVVDAGGLENNLKVQLEKFNQTSYSNREFQQILNYLNKGSRFDKAKKLRDSLIIKRDDEESVRVWFFNTEQWCKNEYQVTNQITQEGRYENRYDVTLLINGLPLIQIELKKTGIELKEAFNQVQRYHKHSFSGTLFEYVQIFVISNGVNTKYFSNNPKQSFEQTFFWTDKSNKKISRLEEFASVFLEKCAVSQMIAEYIVLAEALQIPMIMRPYQYYAARAIVDRVKESDKNGYVWHTTGSGKTLTSFKASQVLSEMPEVKKVLFVVDRKDLDIQTTKEYNSFSEGSVDGTSNTNNLAKQMADVNQKLIVTTIQKMDVVLKNQRYLNTIDHLKDEKVVIIFDECHRSQFGLTHAKIRDFFKRAQLFGFTGTPIFAETNVGGVTTKDVFGDCLHKYIITNAISDNNVLGFSVEYVGKYTQKSSDTLFNGDIEVEGIDTREVLEDPARIEKIVDYVLADWNRKTKKGKFNAVMAVSSVDVLQKYYTLFKEKKPEGFNVATIFTYKANEDDRSDLLDGDVFLDDDAPISNHSRDFLESCMDDYNKDFGTNFSTNTFEDYYKDVQKRVKDKKRTLRVEGKRVDLMLVVNMMLTGFDADTLNTLYVDKNLRYHGLIQAYSRTNRLLNSDKPHGNIICFRNLKEATDKALALFGDENAKEVVIKKPYEEHKEDFIAKVEELLRRAPTPDVVDEMQSETEKALFVKSFRDLLRIKASMETYAEFNFTDLGLDEQSFKNYLSKYLDLYEVRKKSTEEKESILEEIDFEVELIGSDVVNFDYIIKLIANLAGLPDSPKRKKDIDNILGELDRDPLMRNKKDLIKKFIEEQIPQVSLPQDVESAFEKFWDVEKVEAITVIAEKDNIDPEELTKMIGEYLYTQKMPLGNKIIDLLPETPGLLEQDSIIERIKSSIQNLVDVFEW
jgi:type I restriction enzyme R subunit